MTYEVVEVYGMSRSAIQDVIDTHVAAGWSIAFALGADYLIFSKTA